MVESCGRALTFLGSPSVWTHDNFDLCEPCHCSLAVRCFVYLHISRDNLKLCLSSLVRLAPSGVDCRRIESGRRELGPEKTDFVCFCVMGLIWIGA